LKERKNNNRLYSAPDALPMEPCQQQIMSAGITDRV
jgi:hypothetical protein